MGKTLKRQRAREAAEAAGLRVPKRQKQGGAAAAAASAPSGAAGGGNLSFLVSQALQARDWGAAVAHLRAMRAARRAPKLGAVQRWVRDADAAGSEEVAARVICAVLRAAEAGDAAAGGSGAAGAAKAPPPLPPLPPPNGKGAARQPPVVRHPPWSPPPPPPPVTAAAAPAAATADTTSPAPALGQFYEIPRAPGAGGADSFVTGAPVKIFAYPPGSAVTFDASHPPPSRADVPFIPGAFVITGALSAVECGQMLAAGRALGFTRDVDYAFSAPAAASGGGGGGGGVANGQGAGRQGAGGQGSGGGGGGGGGGAGISAFDAAEAARGGGGASAARAVAAREAGMAPVAGRPAEGCVWMADASVLGPLYERVKKLLPQKVWRRPRVGNMCVFWGGAREAAAARSARGSTGCLQASVRLRPFARRCSTPASPHPNRSWAAARWRASTRAGGCTATHPARCTAPTWTARGRAAGWMRRGGTFSTPTKGRCGAGSRF